MFETWFITYGKISILNLQGIVLSQESFSSEKKECKIPPSLNAGTYFLAISDKNGVITQAGKFIKGEWYDE